MVFVLQTVTCISSLIENPESKTPPSYTVSLGHPSGSTQQYVILTRSDSIGLPLGEEGLTSTEDKLVKMYLVCNLVYPAQLQSVFSFLEHIYEIPTSRVITLISVWYAPLQCLDLQNRLTMTQAVNTCLVK